MAIAAQQAGGPSSARANCHGDTDGQRLLRGVHPAEVNAVRLDAEHCQAAGQIRSASLPARSPADASGQIVLQTTPLQAVLWCAQCGKSVRGIVLSLHNKEQCSSSEWGSTKKWCLGTM